MSKQQIPTIESSDDAKTLTKRGASGVLLFAGMNVLGFVFTYISSLSPDDKNTVDAKQLQEQLIGTSIILPILLIAAWRVYTGKGWLVASLVFVWFAAETLLKLAGGISSLVWIPFYFFLGIMLINGVRGCWYLSKQSPQSDSNSEK